MTKLNAKHLIQDLKNLKEKSKPVGPSGLPSPPENSDSNEEGRYENENLTDPGYIGGVTGTGRGRVMG